MKRLLLLHFIIYLFPLFVSAQNIVQITSNITSDSKWTADNIYELSGVNFIYVTNNASLTIEPGTLIKGNPAALVVTRGSKLFAVGTQEKPIVFTSSKPAGQRAAGDWGGIVFLGKATVNVPGGEGTVEGGLDPVLGKYGGNDDTDNSGILKFVRIEFAGIAFQPNNETNGLTLAGVGSGTEISYVQINHGGDDGIEWFGGTVNGKYLVVNKTLDDMFDTDFGYRGVNQFAIGISDPAIADISGSNGFEADNDAQGSTNQPFSQSIFTNVTIIGPKQDSTTVINSNYKRGFHLRRSTKQSIRNSIISGFPTACRLESSNSENYFQNSKEIKIQNNIFTQFTKFIDSTSANSSVIGDSLLKNNRIFNNLSNLGLISPIASVPNLLPMAGSPALTGANFDSIPLFAQKTNYIGAMNGSDWTKCWCEWDALNADYTKGIDYLATITDFSFVVTQNSVLFNTATLAGASYNWNFGDFTNSNLQNPTHNYNALGNFNVSLTITTSRGCVKTISKVISITEGVKEIAVNTDITTDTKWTSNNIYNLTGVPFIYVKNNAILTIEAGTIVKGSPAALVITRGSKLIAVGELDKPIVFTSAKPAGARAPGDWGGIVLLGKATVNCPGGECTIEGGLDPVLGKYGGTDDQDNSGILKYVRIEFAGIAFQPNNETNSLTCGGIGSQTTIDHVQTSLGGDDAFEWFGGVVNGKYLVAYKTIDDMFDTDFGYRGNNQFLFGVSDPNLADISGSNGFEADNDAQGSTNQPISQATFSNATLIGPRLDASSTYNTNFKRSIHLRRSTKQSVVNSIITGFPSGLRIESNNCENYYLNTKEINLANNIVASMGKLFDSTSVNTKSISDQFILQNRIYGSTNELKLLNPFGAKPDATIDSSSPAYTGSDFSKLDNYFEKTNYVGAFEKTNWTNCWCEWDPNQADYSISPIQYFRENVDFDIVSAGNDRKFSPNLTGSYSYRWNFGDGSPVIESDQPTHRYSNSGNYTVELEIVNSRGCVKKVSKSIDVIVVAAKSFESNVSFDVYPNPAIDYCQILVNTDRSQKIQLDIENSLGRRLESKSYQLVEGKNSILLPLNQIQGGTALIIKLITTNGISSRKLIVK